MSTKEFATADVLSVVTGCVMAEMFGVYDILNWMTGTGVYTQPLDSISEKARPVLVAAHPLLQQAIDESAQVTLENWKEWRRIWEDRYGPTMAVPKFTADTSQ